VLDHDVGLALLIAGRLQDLRNAGVLQLRLDPRLVQEPRQEGAVGVVLAPDDLHDHRSLGAFDAASRGQEHLAHAASGQALEQRVALEATRQRRLE
jgi:hypothetical protein